MKKTFLITVVCILAALVFAGCAKFPPYGYQNPEIPDPNDWNTTAYDDDMNVDGVLDEAVWNTTKLSFLSGYVGEVSIDVRAYLGEMGVFIGVEVKDDYLYVNTRRAFFNNTSIELHMAAEDQLMLSKNVAQLRYDVSGRKEQWIGIPSPDGYQYTFHYLPTAHAVKLTGEGAALNSEVAGQGWILETFIPYHVIGLTEKPNAVRIGPAYNHVMNNNADNSERQHADAPGMTYLDPGTFAIFDTDGYNDTRSTVQEGYLFGHASDDTAMSSGWDVTADTEATAQSGNTVLVQEGAMEQYAYIKDYEGTKYYLETDVTFVKLMNLSETHPKFGLISRNNGGATIYYVDAHSGQNNRGIGVNTQYAGGSFQWGEEWTAGSYFNYTNGKYANLAMVRDGEKFYYLLDGYIVHEEEGIAGMTASDPTHVGLFSFNSSLEFKNIKFIDGSTTAGSAAIDSILAGAVVTANDMQIDGTLKADDWTGTQTLTVTDFENTGKTYTVYSKLGTDGLYIAYDAYHAVYENKKSSWFENTNAEFFINGTQEVNQRWVAANTYVSNLGGGLSAIKTDKVENTATSSITDTIYHTVVEAFIPFSKIPFYNEEDEYVRIGYAFKTLGDYMTVGHATNSSGGVAYQGTADDWWFAAGHHPLEATNQFFVDEHGISPTLNMSQTTLTAIDGDISDWDTTAAYYTTNKVSVKDYGNTTKNVTMRAFINSDGLFASWVAEHAILTKTAMEWHQNTNAEIWINNMQFYVTANTVSLGGGQGAMTTTNPTQAGGLYTTVVEVYIPMAILKSEFNYTSALGYVRAGFAFKSAGDTITKQRIMNPADAQPDCNGTVDQVSDWWFPINHNPGFADEQYFVTADGIMTNAVNPLAVTIDGNGADWESLSNYASIAASKVSIYDTVNKERPSGFEVMSFQTVDGVYVLMRATHKKDLIGMEWFQNTNAEIFVGSENLQVWATQYAKADKTYGKMTTTYSSADGCYYSVAEFFIPVGAYVKNDDGTVSMRFCFKVDNGVDAEKITVGSVNDWSTDEYSEDKSITVTDAWWSMNIVSVGANGIEA